jgi:hypothetical protein
MRAKQPHVLRLEVFLTVVLGLFRDVGLHDLFLRFADGEYAVALLPAEGPSFGYAWCTHLLDRDFTLRIKSETAPSGRQRTYMCTWSSTPPMA